MGPWNFLISAPENSFDIIDNHFLKMEEAYLPLFYRKRLFFHVLPNGLFVAFCGREVEGCPTIIVACRHVNSLQVVP